MLTDDERSRLLRSCASHAVARCDTCRTDYRLSQLRPDALAPRGFLCPRCRTDVADTLKRHLAVCGVIAGRRCTLCGREIAFGDLFAIGAGGREHLACHFGRAPVEKRAS